MTSEDEVPPELRDLLARAAASRTVQRPRRKTSSAPHRAVDPMTASDAEPNVDDVRAAREEDNEISAANIARRAPSPDTTESAAVGEELLRKLGIDSGGESTPQD